MGVFPPGKIRWVRRQVVALRPPGVRVGRGHVALEPLLPRAAERVLRVFGVVPRVVVVRLLFGAARSLEQLVQEVVEALGLLPHRAPVRLGLLHAAPQVSRLVARVRPLPPLPLRPGAPGLPATFAECLRRHLYLKRKALISGIAQKNL